ncbi:MAG: class I SAM-dependent methyltransferase [Candidatus Zixiibacteriota bacterium]
MNDIDNPDSLIEEMNRYYDARARWHDWYMSYESNEKMEELMHPIIQIFENMLTGRRVLEIACGTGNWTLVLAKRAESVLGLDISRAVLEIAETKLAGYNNVRLMQGDAYNLRNIDDTFDVVFAADWWSHIPKVGIHRLLESIMSRIHSGSSVIFLDISLHEYFRKEPCYYDRDNNRISKRRLPDGSEFEVVKNFPSESELRNLLADYSNNMVYYDFDSLKRWMVIFEKP